MARLSATTALLLLLLSLLAVAHCRVLEAEPVSDEQGPTKPDATDEALDTEAVVPAHRFAAGQGFLRLPSHPRHRHPCRHGHALLHRNPWWARHHGFLLEDAYRFYRHGGGVPHLVENRAHLVVDVPAELPHVEEPKDAAKEDKAVAEPDPDRSHPDLIKEESKNQLHGEEEEEDESVKAWKREMWRRFRHGHRFHHRRHHHEDDHEQDEEDASGAMKRFHHDDGEDEEEMTRKRFHHDGDDNDALENDEEEEVARRWRKAIMRRRFHHHHRHHHHAEETDEQQEEEGGVMKWFKDLMNRF